MLPTVTVLASLGFIGWLIYRAVSGKPIKAHTVAYGVACITGIFSLAYFLTMDVVPQLIKIVVCILLGVALIIVAAYLQRRQPAKP